MHFIPDREKILKAYDYSHIQPRYSVFRDVKRMNCMFNVNSIREEWEDISRNEWFIYDKIEYYNILDRLKSSGSGLFDEEDYSDPDNDNSFFREDRPFLRKGRTGRTTLLNNSNSGETSMMMNMRNEVREKSQKTATINQDDIAHFQALAQAQGFPQQSVSNISGYGLQTEYNGQGGYDNSFTDEYSYGMYEPQMRSYTGIRSNISRRSLNPFFSTV